MINSSDLQTVQLESSVLKEKSISEKLAEFMKIPGVSDILEWTFEYNKDSKRLDTPYNTSFFQKLGGISFRSYFLKGDISSDDLIKKVQTKIDGLIQELENIKSSLLQEFNGEKLKIEQEAIDYMIISLKTAKSSVPIELEKTGQYKIENEEEKTSLLQEVEKGQQLLYGGRISENPKEVEMTLELICKEFYDKKKYLTEEEKTRYIELYSKLVEKLKEKGIRDINIPEIENFSYKKPERHQFTKDTLEKFGDTMISRENYMKIWQLYIDSMGLKQKVIENPNLSSIYDGPQSLEVPTSINYKEKKLEKVLTLMMHEIGGHYVNQEISEKNGFQVRGAKNVIKEEGLAIILEEIFKGKKLEDIKKEAGFSFPYILVGEFLSKEERQDFINLRIKMDTDGKKYDEDHSRDLRVMRGVPFDSKSPQLKDCSYGRGVIEIINKIEKSNGSLSIVDFFKGKFSIEDCVSGRLDGIITEKMFPLFFPDMIIFMLGKKREEVNHTNFINYLKEKYNGIIPEKEFEKINVISMFSRIKFMEIMNILPKFTN